MTGSLARRLGFEPGARVVIIHCDDIGMCHAANEGAFEALARGPATCGSVMVPCPWFPEAAARARADSTLDLGVHLTLNAEWEGYAWGPVTGARAVPSLVDARGAFPRTTAELLARARPEEVEIELRAQIDRAIAAGIDVTHLDVHMGTLFFPPLGDIYPRLARDYRLPVFAARPSAEALAGTGLEPFREILLRAASAVEVLGAPILDGFEANSLHFAEGEGLAHNLARLRRIGAGVHYLICHPARASEELSAITDDAHCRDFERSFYGGEAGREALAREGLVTIGMRPLRDLMRS